MARKEIIYIPFTDFHINIFSAFVQLECDLISKRIKEALQARKVKGIKLGKPKGTIQGSIYNKDKEKIKELCSFWEKVFRII